MNDDMIDIRIRLQGARQAQAEAIQVSGSIKRIGDAADHTSRDLERGSRHSNVYQQALWGVRRAGQAAVLTLSGLASAALTAGIRFNAALESNTFVLGRFLGSAAAATREMGLLFTLAAKSPFQFGQVVNAARSFLAFGFTLKETNQWLRTLGDTAAGLQLGGEGIGNLVVIFGQIKASGRLLGQDMRQLQQMGINTTQILREQLHLSNNQVQRFMQGTLAIPSDRGLPALIAGLSQKPRLGGTGFGGLANELQGTFTALTSTAKDFASQLFGVLTHPLFVRLEGGLRGLNPQLEQLGIAFKRGGWEEMFLTLDRGVAAGGRLVRSWHQIRDAGTALGHITRDILVPAFLLVWATIGIGSPVMGALVSVLKLAGDHTTVLAIVVGVLSAELLFNATVATLVFGRTMLLYGAYFLLGRVILAQTIVLGILSGAYYRAATAATVAWLAALGPIGVILIGVGLLAGGLVLLYRRWDWFGDRVDSLFSWVRGNWPLLLGILTGPFGLAVLAIVKNFDRIKGAVRGAINFLIAAWNGLEFTIPSFSLPGIGRVGGWTIGVPDIPLLAMGGRALTGGSVIVGDKGPELLNIPGGATVAPLTGGGRDLGELIKIKATTTPVNMDGRHLFDLLTVFEARLEARA